MLTVIYADCRLCWVSSRRLFNVAIDDEVKMFDVSMFVGGFIGFVLDNTIPGTHSFGAVTLFLTTLYLFILAQV